MKLQFENGFSFQRCPYALPLFDIFSCSKESRARDVPNTPTSENNPHEWFQKGVLGSCLREWLKTASFLKCCRNVAT